MVQEHNWSVSPFILNVFIKSMVVHPNTNRFVTYHGFNIIAKQLKSFRKINTTLNIISSYSVEPNIKQSLPLSIRIGVCSFCNEGE